MKNPLRKRLLSELKSDFGRYLVLFVFLGGLISIVSGFLVASSSMIRAYDESFEKYNIEDGNFDLDKEAGEKKIASIENLGVKICPIFFIEQETKEVDSTLRIFKKRTDMDLECLMEGAFPEKEDEIAIDRMYADNNSLSVGDVLTVGKHAMTISGFVALSDYSALFASPSDMMFDAVKFGVAVMTEEGFATLDQTHIKYRYAYQYDDPPKDNSEASVMAEDFVKELSKKARLTGFIPEYANQAILFTGDDLGGDKAGFTVFTYLVIVIIAFIFAITTMNTIIKEATVIGTLRASGYTRRELIVHYMTMPILVMLAAAIVGNILGYTYFKQFIATLYYGSYSLPTYVTRWSAEAFVKTTLVPVLILILINFIALWSKLKLSPLKFMRNDLTKNKRKRAVKLSDRLPFFGRFRIRIMLQNLPNYVTISVGVFFANAILLFGSIFGPMLDKMEENIFDNMICDYQYVLEETDMEFDGNSLAGILMNFYTDRIYSTSTEGAEKYAMTTLKTIPGKAKSENVTVYGIVPESRYVKISFADSAPAADPDGESGPQSAVISNAYANKYGISVGDTITLDEPYEDGQHTFTVSDVYDYPASIAVFLPIDRFAEVFDKREGYFNGYFSNKEITDISDDSIAMKITFDDLNKTARQLRVSMGGMMILFQGFGIIMFAMIIWLLSKIIIEKNAHSISMTKILGYQNSEINRLYVMVTTIITIGALIFTVPVSNFVIGKVVAIVFMDYPGWFSYYVPPNVLMNIFLAGVGTYLAVAFLQVRKVKKIPMTDALKNVE